MPPWKKGDPAERDNPMLWFMVPGLLVNEGYLPQDGDLAAIFDHDGRDSRRVRTYGHLGDDPDKKQRPHYLATRGGVAMHTDPGFARYSHHLILVNEGYRTTGPKDLPFPPLVRGTVYAIDTWAPHAVVPDPRLGAGGYKVDVVVDHERMLLPDEVAGLMTRFLAESPPPC